GGSATYSPHLTYQTYLPYPTYLTYPTYLPYLTRLEAHLEAELKLPLFVARRAREAVRVGRDRGRRIAGRVRGDDRVDAGHVLGVEDVLQLRDDLGADGVVDRHGAGVAEIHVLAHRQIQRVARDAERTIARHAVAVEIQVRADVHRQAAVELQQHADLVAAQ